MTRQSTGIVAACALLAACASVEPQQFVGPNGRTAYSMECSKGGRSLDACYKKAGEVCPAGYAIIDRASTTQITPTQFGPIGSPRHSIAIECKS